PVGLALLVPAQFQAIAVPLVDAPRPIAHVDLFRLFGRVQAEGGLLLIAGRVLQGESLALERDPNRLAVLEGLLADGLVLDLRERRRVNDPGALEALHVIVLLALAGGRHDNRQAETA